MDAALDAATGRRSRSPRRPRCAPISRAACATPSRSRSTRRSAPLLMRAIDEAWTRPADLAGVAARAIDSTAESARSAATRCCMAMLVNAPVCDPALERALVAARRRCSTPRRGGRTSERARRWRSPARSHGSAPSTSTSGRSRRRTGAGLCVARSRDRRDRRGSAAPGSVARGHRLVRESCRPCPRPMPCSRALAGRGSRAADAADRRAIDASGATAPHIPRLTAIDDGLRGGPPAIRGEPISALDRSPPVRPATHRSTLFCARQFPGSRPSHRRRRRDAGHSGRGLRHRPGSDRNGARSFPPARVLAVDLSLASLAYAQRKSRELGADQHRVRTGRHPELAVDRAHFDAITSSRRAAPSRRSRCGPAALLRGCGPAGSCGSASTASARAATSSRRAHSSRRVAIAATPDDIRRCRQEPCREIRALARCCRRPRLLQRRANAATCCSTCRSIASRCPRLRTAGGRGPALSRLPARAARRCRYRLDSPRSLGHATSGLGRVRSRASRHVRRDVPVLGAEGASRPALLRQRLAGPAHLLRQVLHLRQAVLDAQHRLRSSRARAGSWR